MWSASTPEPTFEEVASLLRWGRARRIFLQSYDLLFFDDEDLFVYATRRTRPRYKSEHRRGHRERNER